MTFLEKVLEDKPYLHADVVVICDCPYEHGLEPQSSEGCPVGVFCDCDLCWNREMPTCNCSGCNCTTDSNKNKEEKGENIMKATTREERLELVTENNPLGLQMYDLVQTAGKGIGIVLHKPSANELSVYSMSSVNETHPNDDDGMAYIRRYNVDGTIATHSETTGNKLANRDIYKITGIKSYVNPVLAMKDFINQNPDIEFDPVMFEPNVEEPIDETPTEAETAQTDGNINLQILTMLCKINDKLDKLG